MVTSLLRFVPYLYLENPDYKELLSLHSTLKICASLNLENEFHLAVSGLCNTIAVVNIAYYFLLIIIFLIIIYHTIAWKMDI